MNICQYYSGPNYNSANNVLGPFLQENLPSIKIHLITKMSDITRIANGDDK